MANIPLTQIVGNIGDPDGTRTITSIVVLLVALGLALLLLAVWIYRVTRPDPELLAPLEAMGDRSWRRGDPVWQRRRLDELRPEGAKPLVPSAAPPELDEAFDAGPTASGFDDLAASATAPGADAVDDPQLDGAVIAHPAEASASENGDDQSAPPSADATPPSFIGPTFEIFPDDDFDEDALAAAREQLEQELAESSWEPTPDGQSDGFGRRHDR